MSVRPPAVAGSFYPANRESLKRQLVEITPSREPKLPALAIVAPHAGYIYSGAVAGEVYGTVKLPGTYIILCPNHTGYGSDFDLSPDDEWTTPLGNARVDLPLLQSLKKKFPRSKVDGRGHTREHSLEVQLPFLQHLCGDFTFVPLCIHQHRFEYLEELGNAIADVIRESGREVLIVASSDMNHYESQDVTLKKDQLAIDRMLQLDAAGLYDTVHQNSISMCGYLPATAAIIAARQLGATGCSLLKHATSGEVTGDYSEVVGYASLVIA